ncbi:MAG: hypothetical protein PUK48_06875 [Spirochaetales bacterium]|nr:hypothetical protein [Spirochaetales bacterium]
MKTKRIKITFKSEGVEKTLFVRKKFCSVGEGIAYFKKMNSSVEKIIRAILA